MINHQHFKNSLDIVFDLKNKNKVYVQCQSIHTTEKGNGCVMLEVVASNARVHKREVIVVLIKLDMKIHVIGVDNFCYIMFRMCLLTF